MNERTMTQKNKHFSSTKTLEEHNSEVHHEVKLYKCEECDKTFKLKWIMRRHERIHANERPYQCESCEASFNQKGHLKNHEEAKHCNDKNYKCIVCEEVFKTRDALHRHINRVDPHERKYKCDQRPFTNCRYLNPYVNTHIDKKYVCKVCGKTFFKLWNLKRHSSVHSDKKLHECLICGNEYQRKECLTKHIHKHFTQGTHSNEQTATDN